MRIPVGALFLILAVGLGVADEPPAKDAEKKAEEEKPGYAEAVVVTASRGELPLHEAPSAVSVLDSERIETLPADDHADLMRNVPGINVVQFSASEVQFNTRQAAGNLAQGQQVLIDNRSVIYDFNAIMAPASMPLDFDDIDRIEVVRGPGSAVWGAGATNGVVNIITKNPRDTLGTRVKLGFGELGTRYGAVSHSGATGDVSYRITGSWYEQDAYDRPTGTIPGTGSPSNPGGTPYPPFPNQGTEQPKLDVRVDWDLDDDSTLRFSGGLAEFTGVGYTPSGPATWEDGSQSWYGKVEWIRNSLEVRAHATAVDADSQFFLIPGPGGAPLRSAFAQEAYHLEAVDRRIVGERHLLTYGGNVRTSSYDVGIAPQGDSRDELGAFLQDDIRLAEKWRWLVGARFDDIETMGTAFSPRTSLMYEPVPGQALRLSWNRSFRAPTMLQIYLDLFNVYDLTLPDGTGGTVDLVVPLPSVPNTDLVEETLETIELGWVGNFQESATLTLAVYFDDLDDVARFVPSSFYDSTNPVPGWPLDPALLDVPPPAGFAGLFPATLQYQNIGRIENRGVEASVELRPSAGWTVWANASWQDEPEVKKGIDPVPLPDGTLVLPINLPPDWRANAGVRWNNDRMWVDASGNYQGEGFWTDVLDSRFWGPSDSFTQFHLGAGMRLRDGAIEVSIRAQNVTDEDVQQHVWADLLGRKVTGEVKFRF